MIQPTFPASRRSFFKGNVGAFNSSCAPSAYFGWLGKSGANSKPIHLATLDLVPLALSDLEPCCGPKE